MDNITELNELIYAGTKSVWNKISAPQMNRNRNTKPGWEIKQQRQVKKLRQAKILGKEEKNTVMNWDEKTKTKQQKKLTMYLEEINQKMLAKEKRLKGYQEMVLQCNQNRIFREKTRRKFYQRL